MGFGKLIKHILRNGKFKYSEWDFEDRRISVLADLSEFCPPGSLKRSRKARLMKNGYVKAWISEAAYLARSVRSRGGHLALPEAQMWYIRIPRTASTALSRAALLAKFPGLRKHAPSAEQINLLTDLHLHRSLFGYTNTTRVVTVVRNPYSRIVSVYRQFFERGDVPFIYEDYLFGIFRRDLSFEKFVETLQLIPDPLKDQHLRPQHTFLKFYEQANIPVEVMKLEEPETINTALNAVGLTFEPFNVSDAPYDYQAYYTPHTRDVVFSVYREDFRRFGYARRSSLSE